MAARAFNLDAYQNLLSEAHPRVPRTDTDNQQLLTKIRGLQQKTELTAEELELMNLMLVLVENFEQEHYSTKASAPDAVLRELMRARGIQAKDLYEIFGSKGTTSEVLRGKRAISKAAAKALAERFQVSLHLFL